MRPQRLAQDQYAALNNVAKPVLADTESYQMEVWEEIVLLTLPGEGESVIAVLPEVTSARGRRVSAHAIGDGAGTAALNDAAGNTLATLALADDEVRFESDGYTWALYYNGIQGG